MLEPVSCHCFYTLCTLKSTDANLLYFTIKKKSSMFDLHRRLLLISPC